MYKKDYKVLTKHNVITVRTFYLYLLSVIYAFFLGWGYEKLSKNYYVGWFPYSPNICKILYGMVWCSIIYFLIEHDNKKVSSFLLEILYFFQIIPITVIFSLKSDSIFYYTIICISTVVCEGIVIVFRESIQYIIITRLNYWKIFLMGLLVALLIYRLYIYGVPSLKALNIYAVYDLRSSGVYGVTKYWGYIQKIVVTVCIPILLTFFFVRKKMLGTFAVLITEFVIYLYTGEKTILLVGPLVFGTVWLCKNCNFPYNFWLLFVLAVIVMVIGEENRYVTSFYDLFVRRLLLVPANLKFLYYDFFSNNEKIGLAGIFPRIIADIHNPYGSGPYEGYAYLIGKEYFDRPQMSCDTGFIAEGFMRFGELGILGEFIILGIIIRWIDKFSERTSYVYGIGCSIYFMYGLTENHLIDQLLFGSTTLFVIFIFTYCNVGKMKGKSNERI